MKQILARIRDGLLLLSLLVPSFSNAADKPLSSYINLKYSYVKLSHFEGGRMQMWKCRTGNKERCAPLLSDAQNSCFEFDPKSTTETAEGKYGTELSFLEAFLIGPLAIVGNSATVAQSMLSEIRTMLQTQKDNESIVVGISSDRAGGNTEANPDFMSIVAFSKDASSLEASHIYTFMPASGLKWVGEEKFIRKFRAIFTEPVTYFKTNRDIGKSESVTTRASVSCN